MERDTLLLTPQKGSKKEPPMRQQMTRSVHAPKPSAALTPPSTRHLQEIAALTALYDDAVNVCVLNRSIGSDSAPSTLRSKCWPNKTTVDRLSSMPRILICAISTYTMSRSRAPS